MTQKLGPISKQGDRYVRSILVVGAHAVLKRARLQPEKYHWLTQLLAEAERSKARARRHASQYRLVACRLR